MADEQQVSNSSKARIILQQEVAGNGCDICSFSVLSDDGVQLKVRYKNVHYSVPTMASEPYFYATFDLSDWSYLIGD